MRFYGNIELNFQASEKYFFFKLSIYIIIFYLKIWIKKINIIKIKEIQLKLYDLILKYFIRNFFSIKNIKNIDNKQLIIKFIILYSKNLFNNFNIK